jgi:hypothetical protein
MPLKRLGWSSSEVEMGILPSGMSSDHIDGFCRTTDLGEH